MRAWLSQAFGEHGACGQIAEGCSLPQHQFDDRFGEGSDIGITVINLREPVARVESFIKMNLGDVNDTCAVYSSIPGDAPEFCNHLTPGSELKKTWAECYSVPRNTTQCCWPNTYVDLRPGHPRTLCHEQQKPMWNCWTNQYVKSLVGTDRKNSPESVHQWLDVDEIDLELAKQRLARFSAVLITEWFGHPSLAEYLSKHVFHVNETIPIQNRRDHSNGHGFSGMFTREDRDFMSSANTYDSKLYEFAKTLALKRMMDAGYDLSIAELEAARPTPSQAPGPTTV